MEEKIGTNSTNPDTDADGFTDGVEYYNLLFESTDPLRKDVYVEVDWMNNTNPNHNYFENIQSLFKSAPVSNPDGSEGITLHIIYDETVPSQNSLSTDFYYESMYPKIFDYKEWGVKHILFVKNLTLENKTHIGGVHRKHSNSMLVEDRIYTWQTETTIFHELGHSLGISNSDYRGVDSHSISFENYSSVMNYNHKRIYGLSYSTTEEFNDWTHIERTMRTKTETNNFAFFQLRTIVPCYIYTTKGCQLVFRDMLKN